MSSAKSGFFSRSAVLLPVLTLLIVLNFAFCHATNAAPYDSDTISMFTMNSPTALRRIRNGTFSIISHQHCLKEFL